MALTLRGRRLVVLVVVGVVVVAGLGWWLLRPDDDGVPDVGQCVTVGGRTTATEVDEAECGHGGVLYQVASDDGDCDPVELQETVPSDDGDVHLCLVWDVEEGACVRTGDTGQPDEKVDCADNIGDSGTWRVVTRTDSATATCADRERAYTDVRRSLTYCLGPDR